MRIGAVLKHIFAGVMTYIVIATLLAVLVFQFADPANVVAWLVVVIAPGILTFSAARQMFDMEQDQLNFAEAKEKARESEVEHLYLHIEKHLANITRNLDRAIQRDEYGGVARDNRAKEIDRFLKSINFEPTYLRQSEELYVLFVQIVGILAKPSSNEQFDPRGHPQDGLYFESWVAESLKQFGWEATPTIGSGDQGVDVTARKDGITIAIQCKRYAGSVGNKAVQEVVAGKAFYGLDHAVVISTGSYTRSASDLASVCGVHLLVPDDIPQLSTLLR